jgi:probable DNA metabolism protein
MKIFTIDYSIDGLLSALFISFTEKIIPDKVENVKDFQPRFDAIIINVKTNVTHAERVKAALFKYGGNDVIAHLKVCLMSCDLNALTYAFNYAYYMLKMRDDVSNRLAEKCVSDFSYAVQKVLHERHIVTGFLRFKESANGVLYAQYSPDNDITAILAPHFLRRLGNNPFIIHDLKRNVIAISNGKTIKNTVTNLPPSFTPAQAEKELNDLWRRYYKQINIKERPHTKQQDGYFPRRYRKYCFETFE